MVKGRGILKTDSAFLIIHLGDKEDPLGAFYEERITLFIEILFEIEILEFPSKQRLHLIDVGCS